MLRWAIAYAINRLFIVVAILLAMKAFGVSSTRIESQFREAFNVATPFDEIESALK